MGTRLISAHAHQGYRVIMSKPHTDLKCTLGMFVRTFVIYSYILVSAFACVSVRLHASTNVRLHLHASACVYLHVSAFVCVQEIRRPDTNGSLCLDTSLFQGLSGRTIHEIEWNAIKVMGYIMGAVSGSGLLTA